MNEKELTAEAKRIQKEFLKNTSMYWSIEEIKKELIRKKHKQ